MALSSSCRLLTLRVCVRKILNDGAKRLCIHTSSHSKAYRPHRLSCPTSILPALSDFSGGRSLKWSRKTEYSQGEEAAVQHWRSALCALMAFSLFSSPDERTEEQKTEDEIILLLKKAKYSMMQGELDAANGFLHKAIRLAHQSHNNDAIIYTYSLMANLAFVQGQLDNAEKLFKAAMSFMLSGGTSQDDNAVIEMSLKLATIYATQNKNELAEHGFQFCTESLEAKLEKQKELPPDAVSEEERKDTRLLLGLSLDTRARYLASSRRFTGACRDYRQALQICQEEQGETHPQTLVLMSDLATILDLQGKHDEALALVKKAVELAQAAGHPDQHVLLGNMAGILMHKGEFDESIKLYEEALALAQAAGDTEALQQLEEGLKELSRRREEKNTASEEPSAAK
ncbi:tetratricopeptide repeat protein 19, mitochondrial [Trichomycterus rosablanca]|uniref:tetratricopeptide repeat protein 19, mitochondrial n=1 Tax=Trichomycterus rosablanca TaxID=2290929 RepID=UPI002F35254F